MAETFDYKGKNVKEGRGTVFSVFSIMLYMCRLGFCDEIRAM